jgi:adenylate cyclase
VMSYETYALVREVVRAHPLEPITMKGISREVVPYAVDGLLQDLRQRPHVISEQDTGVELFLDLDVIDPAAATRTRRLLEDALAALKEKERDRTG